MDNKKEIFEWLEIAELDLKTSEFLFSNMKPIPLEVRYPYKIELDIEICKKALENATKIKEFILMKIKGIIDD